jgi:hypothetical protein
MPLTFICRCRVKDGMVLCPLFEKMWPGTRIPIPASQNLCYDFVIPLTAPSFYINEFIGSISSLSFEGLIHYSLVQKD